MVSMHCKYSAANRARWRIAPVGGSGDQRWRRIALSPAWCHRRDADASFRTLPLRNFPLRNFPHGHPHLCDSTTSSPRNHLLSSSLALPAPPLLMMSFLSPNNITSWDVIPSLLLPADLFLRREYPAPHSFGAPGLESPYLFSFCHFILFN